MYFEIILLFSPLWWCCFLGTLGIIVALLVLGFFIPKKLREIITISLGSYLLFDIFFRQYYLYKMGLWNISYSLPFDFCSIMQTFCAFALLKRWQWFYEITLFIGIAGPLQALITPAFVHGMEGYSFYAYFIIHAADVFSPLFLTLHFGMKPRTRMWWRGPLSFFPIVMMVGCFNRLVQGNYMFLSDRPQLQHPAILFEWPYYLMLWTVLFFLTSFGISRIFRLSEKEREIGLPEVDLNLEKDLE